MFELIEKINGDYYVNNLLFDSDKEEAVLFREYLDLSFRGMFPRRSISKLIEKEGFRRVVLERAKPVLERDQYRLLGSEFFLTQNNTSYILTDFKRYSAVLSSKLYPLVKGEPCKEVDFEKLCVAHIKASIEQYKSAKMVITKQPFQIRVDELENVWAPRAAVAGVNAAVNRE